MAPAATGLGNPGSSLYHGARGTQDIYFPVNQGRPVGSTPHEVRDPWEMEKAARAAYVPSMRGMEEEGLKGGFFSRR